MRYHQSSAPISKGFTLLEVMLVLMLMGLVVGTVVMNIGTRDHSEVLERQARRFQVVVNMASDQAILTQSQYGIYVEDNQYSFAMLDDDQRWQPMEDDDLFTAIEIEEPYAIEIQLDGLPWEVEEQLFDAKLFDEELSVSDDGVDIGDEEEKEPPPPQVFISSSGDITPFSLIFKYEPEFGDERAVYFRVNAEDLPPLTVSEPLELP